MKNDIIEVPAENELQDNDPVMSEIEGIKKEQKKQRKLLTAILVMLIILTSVIVIYLLYKMTLGSIFGKLIGLVAGLFGA